MSDLETITYRPGAGEDAWAFGGAAPVMRLRPPCVLDLYTEDCFAGRVRSADDLVSKLNITGLNPQTGPFWIEGAEPGDTVAGGFVSMGPARGWAAAGGRGGTGGGRVPCLGPPGGPGPRPPPPRFRPRCRGRT